MAYELVEIDYKDISSADIQLEVERAYPIEFTVYGIIAPQGHKSGQMLLINDTCGLDFGSGVFWTHGPPQAALDRWIASQG